MRRTLRAVLHVLGALLGLLYILNPGAGVIELLPDALPIVGNLDEAAMMSLLLWSLRGLKQMRDERALEAASPGSG